MSLAATSLPGGLTVVTERMPQVRSVALGFWVGTGSVDESPVLAGASHFLEHLLFKGTEGRSARSIAETVDALGGDMNAFTTKEYTTFYLRLLAEHLEVGMDILSDIIWQPAFRPSEVEAERQVIVEEILMNADEPGDLVHEVFAGAMFPGHPLGREVLGEERSVRALTRSDIAGFHAEHYRPVNVVVAAAGLVEHDRVVEGIDKRLCATPGGVRPARQAPKLPPEARSVVTRPTEQAHLVVGVPAPDRSDERRHQVSILDHILGGGMSSRLFQVIREERGLAYSVYSYRLAFQGAGALAAYAGTSPRNARQVLDLMRSELHRVGEGGVSEAEVESARSHLRGSMSLGLEDSGARMTRLGHDQLVHGRVEPVEEIERRLASVRTEEVSAMARELLAAPLTVAAVGPFGDEVL